MPDRTSMMGSSQPPPHAPAQADRLHLRRSRVVDGRISDLDRVILAAIIACTTACAPGPDRDRAPPAAPPADLSADRLEAMARYDYPLADSMHACIPLDPEPAGSADAVTAVVRNGARYRCELRAGMEIDVSLIVDTTETEFQFITGLRIDGDAPEVRELHASSGEPPPRGFRFLGTQDLDGDGLRELKVLAFWGVTGNVGWDFWQRDTAAARFVPAAALTAMSDPEPLLGAPCVRTWGGGGMAARIYTAVVYCNESGNWIERWHEHQEWDDANRFFLRTLRVRLPGQDSLTALRTDTVRDTILGR